MEDPFPDAERVIFVRDQWGQATFRATSLTITTDPPKGEVVVTDSLDIETYMRSTRTFHGTLA
jgi:hypothetical protein